MINLYYSTLCRKLGLVKTTDWGIAIRRVSNGYDTILSNKGEGNVFEVIENIPNYWFADPLLFSENEKTWLFVEAFNINEHKGELGVFDIIDGKATNFRLIVKTPTHMSYPFVFKHRNEYYMIPETGAAKEIVLYKAEIFPDVWKREKILLSGEIFRDSTIIRLRDNSLKILSYKQTGTNRFDMKYFVTVFDLDMDNKCLIQIEQFIDKKKINRPAGPLLNYDNILYRVSQKCDRVYGESIYVFKTDSSFSFKNDHIVNQLRGEDIKLDNGSKPILVHTYSQSGGYEVIDYRCLK